jgi:hypothetical protein
LRKPILLVSAVYFVAMILVAILIYRASPGPRSQEILGVGIGSYDDASGVAYLSGRRLNCDRFDGTEAYSSCTVGVAGKTLEIRAQRNATTEPNQLGGACEAFYADKEWPCSIGSRHVGVHWFAYIREPLGLTEDQLETLRHRYFFENVAEEAYLTGMVVVPILTMLVVMLAMAVWFWPRIRRKVWLALLVAASGVASLVGTFVLVVLLTRGFWD